MKYFKLLLVYYVYPYIHAHHDKAPKLDIEIHMSAILIEISNSLIE